ncbi:MAG TPA: D-alanyl-D-alanine carboxypeptidase/D-alanyl-D-alanine-endopeptidase [Gammaproteobacteria bacterium]|nr:D-alanyl-D-alanine carboxypeptidase/D-alanyl-D-alanine-endopeptidase [Gammaproteobacteria bacterium]
MNLSGKFFIIFIGLLLSWQLADAKKTRHHVHHHTLSYVQPVYGTQNLTDELNRLMSGIDSKATIGVQIKSMKQGDILYTHNASTSLTPASILKILTAEAALIYLGPDYKFQTNLMTNAKSTTNGMINGDVYLVHSGDPTLTYYDLTDLMVALKSQQIQGVNGNVYVDNTAYDQDNLGPGWILNDTHYCYAAPINASIINHNCVTVSITPAKMTGYHAVVIQNPRYFYSSINNSVITKPAGSHSCHLSLNSTDDNTITVDGCMPKGHYSRSGSIVINNIVKYNESLLQNSFKRFGINVTGGVSAKAAPPHLTVLATHESKPLHLLINEMLKKSDNIIAGSLFKKMGELYSNQPGSWSNGGAAVKQILSQKAAVNTWQMHAVDGSGLSSKNQITASQMIQVLDYAYHNYATNYEFISALPIAGVDGTLKYRLKNIAWKVRAKTGTKSKEGVVALAGYAVSKDHEPIAFVIMVNGRYGNTWKYREIADAIVTALTRYTRT